ncbi:hypothetical protein PYCCODRAFT_1463358 [Trametes coccinea BRFM310]|uniref:Uncharacterized protein n=1 Tax=Trametes coccinea (strain BRFM310) TaxID=1353009 RepID=A0A1Y2J7B0_TRAC3|nr:hypothetical protein PYCCODRAFT_1463358 [Trametes coccinea BRFM310]
MSDPVSPPTAALHYTPYRAVSLQRDEGQPLKSFMVILRHRYLRRQHVIVSAASIRRSKAIAKPTPGIPINTTNGDGAHEPSERTELRRVHDLSHPEPGPSGSSSNPGSQIPAAVGGTPAPNVEATSTSQPRPGSTHPQAPPIPAASSSGLDERTPGTSPSSAGELPPGNRDDLAITRHEFKIRGRKDQTWWFASRGTTYILEPGDTPARFGDLYVHTTSNFDHQIWLRERDLKWRKITLLHPHPYLAGYVLHMISNGEPRWVRSATIRTYDGRQRKAEREKAERERAEREKRLPDTIERHSPTS